VFPYYRDRHGYHWKGMDNEAVEMLARQISVEGDLSLSAAVRRAFETGRYPLVLLTLGVAGSGHALTDVSGCNNKLLCGHYGFTLQGTEFPITGVTGPTGLQVGVAMADFDGEGSFEQIDSVTIAGTALSDFTHTRANGKYTVNADCTGTFTIDFTDGGPPVVTGLRSGGRRL
jgi:hypothetical protein